MVQLYNSFPCTPIIMKLHIQTHDDSRICPSDFGVNSQGHNVLITENSKVRLNYSGTLLLSLYTYHHETSHKDFL